MQKHGRCHPLLEKEISFSLFYFVYFILFFIGYIIYLHFRVIPLPSFSSSNPLPSPALTASMRVLTTHPLIPVSPP